MEASCNQQMTSQGKGTASRTNRTTATGLPEVVEETSGRELGAVGFVPPLVSISYYIHVIYLNLG